MKDLIILGAGGVAYEIVEIVDAINAITPNWNIIGYLDDNKKLLNENFLGIEVIGTIDQASDFEKVFFISSIGHPDRPKLRKEVRDRIPFDDDKFATIIHPTAVVVDTAKIGFGCLIQAQCTISTKVLIGNNVLISYGSIVGHESTIGDDSAIGPNVTITSDVNIGNSVYVGPGAVFRNEIRIGNNVLIGIGSIVTESVDDNKRYYNHLRAFSLPLKEKIPYEY